ncbi:MAG: hypothetical protein GY832_16315 [Chloroflexi bacterium]|nr:hypothetical protein [Chloroflexota bacterium]
MKERHKHQPTSPPESQADQLTVHTTSSGTVVVRPKAERDFDRAHQRAFIQDALSFLRHDSPHLLSFEAVCERLGLGERVYNGVQSILLDQIVGSVGRYNDFTRTFLPRTESVRSRWQRVDQISTTRGMAPIRVYQVGQVYFVLDGNHRVSVARQMGATTIDAHVWEYETRVPLEPDDAPKDVPIRQEYLTFLERTQLDKHRPEQYIILTSAGRYQDFEEQIAIHRHYMELERDCNVSFKEAAIHWYDRIYCPIVEVIHREHMLQLFPGRTEADLVNWIIRHQAHLRQQYSGQEIPSEELAGEVAGLAHRSPWRRFVSWLRRKVLRWPVYNGKPWQP